MPEQNIDAQIVIDLLRKDNEELRYQLLLAQAQALTAQKAQEDAQSPEEGDAQ